jgi:putative glycosyltransferase (TIGR04372 family)
MFAVLSRQCVRVARGIAWRVQRYWALPLAVWPVLLMRLSAPFVLLRLHSLRAERIGHFLSESDSYLSQRMIAGQPRRTIDKFFFTGVPSNRMALKLVSRCLPVSQLWDHVDRASRLIAGAERHVTPWLVGPDRWGFFDRCPPHFRFTDAEIAQGEAFLAEIGAAKRPIVCLFNRDSAYLSWSQKGVDFSYHDYRDSSIGNYLPAARELVRSGYFVIRMGAAVQETIADEENIVDYASGHRTDFLDLYIASRCTFSVGTSTGLSDLGRIFRRPTASANVCPFLTMQLYSADWRELFIPKLYRWKNSRRIVTMTEMFQNGSHNFGHAEQFEEAGILLEENQPEDIVELAREMRDRIEGNWIDSEEDQTLQDQFWALSQVNSDLRPRIGRAFLRKYADQILR